MKTTHTKQNKELTEQRYQERQTDKKTSLFYGSLAAILIAISPYIFYLYTSFPETEIWKTTFFTFESYGFKNLNDFAWLFTSKFVPILLLVIWFITCKHWWYHVILIPIAMYSFQLFTVINDDKQYIDEVEIYWMLPIMMIVVPIVYLIRIKLFDKLVLGIDLKKIEAELEEYDRKEKEAEN